MKNNLLVQCIAAVSFIVLSLVLINPFGLWMPDMTHMLVLGLAVVAFGVFANFLVHEGDGDEREQAHRNEAGHIAYVVGGGILLIGIVAQTLAHMLDAWLVYALIGMLVAKVGMRVYDEWYR